MSSHMRRLRYVWCPSRNCSRREIRNTTRSLSKIFIFVIVAVKMASASADAREIESCVQTGSLSGLQLVCKPASGQTLFQKR